MKAARRHTGRTPRLDKQRSSSFSLTSPRFSAPASVSPTQALGAEQVDASAEDGETNVRSGDEEEDAVRMVDIRECLSRISEAENALQRARDALSFSIHGMQAPRTSIDHLRVGESSHAPFFGAVAPAVEQALGQGAEGDGSHCVSAPLEVNACAVPEEAANSEGPDDDEEDSFMHLDRILLDVPVERVFNHAPSSKTGQEDEAHGALHDQPKHPTLTKVLVSLGRDPVTGVDETLYVERNRPLWVKMFRGISFCQKIRCRLPVFHPEADIRVVWNMMGFIFIVFEAFLIPLYIAFNYDPKGVAFSVVSVVNSYFISDIVFSFFTGYNDNGIPVLAPGMVAARYASTWFLPDVLSGIPWEWLPSSDNYSVDTLTRCLRFMKGLRLLRVARLFKLMRLGVFNDAVEIFMESNRLVLFLASICRTLFLLFLVTHWLACAWFIVGSVAPPEGEDTWITKFMKDERDVASEYIHALYFTLTTMTTVGYGDISPQNMTEIHFVLFLLLVASVVFASLMGSLTDLVLNLNNKANTLTESKVMLGRYLRWRAVPKKLYVAVREHFIFLWDTNDSFDEYEGSIKQMLTPHLKQELSYHIYGRILRSAPFLSWMREYELCLKDLSESVNSVFLAEGDYLFRIGQQCDIIYVFLKGTLYISQNEKVNVAIDHHHKTSDHAKAATDATDFVIPRNKEASAWDVFNMMMSNVSKVIHSRQHVEEQKKKERFVDLIMGPKFNAPAEDEDFFLEDGQDLLDTHVDSSILQKSFRRLHRQDANERRAVVYIQRRWRNRHGKVLEPRVSKKNTIVQARSKYVHAPAYLGESCLWTPFEDWDTKVEKFRYAARCETRGEFVYLERMRIKDIIDRFSPWLRTRFEFFRKAVLENMAKADAAKLHVNLVRRSVATNASKTSSSTSIYGRDANHSDMIARDLKDIPEERTVFMHGGSPATPLSIATSKTAYRHRGSHYSFREAAKNAIARVSLNVTPRPPTQQSTPSSTPRLFGVNPQTTTPHQSGSGQGAFRYPEDNVASSDVRLNGNLREPLLQDHSGVGSNGKRLDGRVAE